MRLAFPAIRPVLQLIEGANPVLDILKKPVRAYWRHAHEKVFHAIKRIICQDFRLINIGKDKDKPSHQQGFP